MPITGYNHMALQVSDLASAERFYEQGLGLEKAPRPEFAIPGAWYAVGDSLLHLIVLDGGPKEVRRMPHVALNVDLDALRQINETAPAAGGTAVTPLVSRTDTGTEVWTANFADPDGNVVELTTA